MKKAFYLLASICLFLNILYLSSCNHDYTDLSEFWSDFKEAGIKGNHAKIRDMAAFPFFSQYNATSESEFKDFKLPDYMIEKIGNTSLPVSSSMAFDNYLSLYEVDCGGPVIYFAKVNGIWRFVGITYGE